MKQILILFDRATWLSASNGAAQASISADSLRKLLGAAKSIRVQIIGFRNDPNTGVKLYMYETSHPDMRPTETLQTGAPFWTGTEATTLRPQPETITGPFGANVEFKMEVRNTSAATQVAFDGMVVVTLIMEE